MFRNHIKIAWRNLKTNRTFSILNISGLAVGMGVAMLISIWIWDEFSYNKSFPGNERIARVMHTTENNGQIETSPTTNYPLAAVLRKDYADRFEAVVLASGTWEHSFDVDGKRLGYRGAFMEEDAAMLFGLQILQGVSNGLGEPNSVMISEKIAKAAFPDGQAVGKLMRMDREHDVKVTAVYRDIPVTSTLRNLEFLAPWKFYFDNEPWLKNIQDPWRPNAFTTYVKVKSNTDFEKTSLAIRDVRLKHVNAKLARLKPRLHLHAMNKWHLYDEFREGINTGGRIQYVWLFMTIGIFVLVLACINFMNLSTARSEKRAKEVGIRKTIGSVRGQLVLQFFCESLLYTMIAFLFAMIMVQMALPFFNEIADKQMFVPWSSVLFWTAGIGFCLVTGFVAGLYPAFYLSSFKPIRVLKGSFKQGRFAAVPRQVLVVMQFTVSIILIIGTIVVFEQIRHARNRPVGYNREGLIEIGLPGDALHTHFDAVRNELRNKKIIVEMSESDAPSTDINSTSTGFEWEGKDPSLGVNFPVARISYNYGKTVGWEFLEGRDYSPEFKSDSAGLIINQAAAEYMGFRNNAVGKTISWDGDNLQIVGVIRNVIAESPYAAVRPSVYPLNTYSGDLWVARLHPSASLPVALKELERLFKKYYPDFEFNHR
ncbi:MAG: FtsX-like permease family protein, partial [Sphingobacteriales bacterium]